jgi:hypothetical protein
MSPLFGSFHDGHARTRLRIGIAAIAGLELLVEAAQVASQSQDPQHYRAHGVLALALAGAPWAAWIIDAMILLGLIALARDRRPVLAGAWALAWACVLSEWQTGVFGSPSRNAFFPGAALLGWVLGELWGARRAPPGLTALERRELRERFAEAGALGCIAAAYVGSCASKLLAGASWATGMQVRMLVLRQQPLASWSWLLDYREALIEDPALGRAAAIATLVIEGGAFMLLLGPRLRLLWAALIVGVHLNILLLCTMPYLEPIALLLLLALPWPQLLRRRSGAVAHDAAVIPGRIAVVLAAIVVLGWLLAPWGWRDEHREEKSPTRKR